MAAPRARCLSHLPLRSLNTFYSAPPRHRFYIIANTKLTPEWKATDASLPSMAQNALAALGRAHAAGDLFRLYLLAKREGGDFNLAAIPESFSQRPAEPFEPRYMRALFQVGLTHQQWLKEPPELERGEQSKSVSIAISGLARSCPTGIKHRALAGLFRS